MNGNKNVIPQLLHPEDIDVSKPDEKSVLTYIANYYHTKMKTGATPGAREGQQRCDEDQGNSQTMESNFSTSRKSPAAGELGGI